MTSSTAVSPPGTRSWLRTYLMACRLVHAYNPRAVYWFALCVVLSLCTAALAASLPYLMGQAIDSFQLGAAAFWLAPAAYGVVWSAQKVLLVLTGLAAALFTSVTQATMAQAVFDRRVTAFDPKERSIDLGKETEMIDRAEGSFADITIIVVLVLGGLAVEVAIGLAVFASKVNGVVALCVALGVAFLLWTAVDVARRSTKAHRTLFDTRNVWKTWLTDRLAQARWARLYGAELDEFERAEASAVAYSRGMRRVHKAYTALSLYQVLVAALFFGSVSAYLIFARPGITGGDFAALTGYALQMVLPMTTTAYQLMELQKSKLALGDVDLSMAGGQDAQAPNPPAPKPPVPTPVPTPGGVLQVKGFRAYTSERTLDAHFELNGSVYAIKGESGAGKSCLLEALMAAFDQYGGSVCLDGVDIRETPFERLIRFACYVPAQPIIINDRSFRDNLVWGLDRAASDAELQASMARLKLAPYHGLHDVLGRQGRALSSGEAQRLGLARALLRQPALLLLDEPTANLDQESREIVIEIVQEANATVIAATHDPVLLAAADRVFEFERR